MKDDKKAILYVSITVLSWSTVASAFKLALSSLTYYELLLISSITALIAFAIILTFRKRWFLLRSVSRRQWWMFAIAGCFSCSVFRAFRDDHPFHLFWNGIEKNQQSRTHQSSVLSFSVSVAFYNTRDFRRKYLSHNLYRPCTDRGRTPFQ